MGSLALLASSAALPGLALLRARGSRTRPRYFAERLRTVSGCIALGSSVNG